MGGSHIGETRVARELLGRKGEFADFLVQYLTEKKESPELDPQTESELDDLQRELEQTLGKVRVLWALTDAIPR